MYRQRALSHITDLVHNFSPGLFAAARCGFHTSACVPPSGGAPQTCATSTRPPLTANLVSTQRPSSALVTARPYAEVCPSSPHRVLWPSCPCATTRLAPGRTTWDQPATVLHHVSYNPKLLLSLRYQLYPELKSLCTGWSSRLSCRWNMNHVGNACIEVWNRKGIHVVINTSAIFVSASGMPYYMIWLPESCVCSPHVVTQLVHHRHPDSGQIQGPSQPSTKTHLWRTVTQFTTTDELLQVDRSESDQP